MSSPGATILSLWMVHNDVSSQSGTIYIATGPHLTRWHDLNPGHEGIFLARFGGRAYNTDTASPVPTVYTTPAPPPPSHLSATSPKAASFCSVSVTTLSGRKLATKLPLHLMAQNFSDLYSSSDALASATWSSNVCEYAHITSLPRSPVYVAPDRSSPNWICAAIAPSTSVAVLSCLSTVESRVH